VDTTTLAVGDEVHLQEDLPDSLAMNAGVAAVGEAAGAEDAEEAALTITMTVHTMEDMMHHPHTTQATAVADPMAMMITPMKVRVNTSFELKKRRKLENLGNGAS
jgi:hypothetical protein